MIWAINFCLSYLTILSLFLIILVAANQAIFNFQEGLTIGVKCKLIICRGHIRISKGNFFVIDGSMLKMTSISDCSLCHYKKKLVSIWKCCKSVGSSKLMWEVKLLEFNMKQENIYPVAEWGNFCTFCGLKKL